MIPFVVFLSCLATTSIAYWVMTRRSTQERQILNQRLEETAVISGKSEIQNSRFVRRDLLSEMPMANRILKRLRIATSIRRMIEQADLRLTVMRLLMLAGLTGAIGGLLASLFSSSLLFNGICALVTGSIPLVYVWHKRRQRLHLFLEQLPEGLNLVSRALSAGHAFTESMHMVATEMAEPIAGEFGKTYEEQRLGLSYKMALRNLSQRIPLLELRLCVTAILIQRETGGNLAEILERVAVTIRERFRIMEDLNTLTTASRVSAWILCALPMVIAGMLFVVNPGYLDVLWTDPRGQRLVWVAAGMQITGMLIVRKIMRIKI